MGKLKAEELEKLLSCIKADPKVIVAPKLGFDSGVHTLDGDKCMVVSTDPCLGVPAEWFGWLLIHYVASDIALFGARMQFCTINLLGSPGTEPKVFHQALTQICSAANELDATVVTGHTGTYQGISTLVGVCTGYGIIHRDRLITPAGAKAGDLIALIKPIGLETAVNFALTHRALAEKLFGARRAKELTGLVSEQSCVKEALVLAETGAVHALHDATEGGLTAALNEMAKASRVGFKIDWERLPIPLEVQILRESYHLSDTQLLSISSTGTVLAAVSPEARDSFEDAVQRHGAEAAFLGCFTKDRRRILVKEGKESKFPDVADDPYARILFPCGL